MRFLTTAAFAVLATSAVAKKIATVGWDKYADERGFEGHDDPMEHGHVAAREAEPEATEAWENAHGGKAPTYKPYGEHESHGHYVPRDLPHFDEKNVDTSLEGYDHSLLGAPRHVHARSEPIPHFDEPNVDTSLEGYAHHLVDEPHRAHPRSAPAAHHDIPIPHFDEPNVDTSLEGYDHSHLHARSEEDEEWESKYHSLTASHKAKTHEHGESKPTAWTEQEWMPKPTHVARALKDIYDHYAGKAGDEEAKAHPGMKHHARDAEARMPYEHVGYEPIARHHARDAEAAIHAPYTLVPEPHVTPFHRPHHARDVEEEEHEGQWKTDPSVEARMSSHIWHSVNSESAKHSASRASAARGHFHPERDVHPTHHGAHPTESHTWSDEHPTWTKHTATETKSSGWLW